MVPGWHASAFLCILAAEGQVGPATGMTIDQVSEDPEASNEQGGAKDIHEDSVVLDYLRTGDTATTVTAKERDQILQRAKRFKWEGTHLLRV